METLLDIYENKTRLNFLCNIIFSFYNYFTDSKSLSETIEKHKPKKQCKKYGGWWRYNDRESRVKFLKRLIKIYSE